jgi:hypothetical protein
VTEAALAAVVVAHLEARGCDVYQEVELPRGSGGCADIVAIAGTELWIVETKVNWSLDLLEQCVDRRRFAQRVFAAVPLKRGFATHERLALELRIGAMPVVIDRRADRPLKVGVYRDAPALPGERSAALRNILAPRHKTAAPAGTNGGGRYTLYVATCDRLREVVEQEPGTALADAVTRITHHYASHSSAISSLGKWIKRGKVPGVTWRRGERDELRLHTRSA